MWLFLAALFVIAAVIYGIIDSNKLEQQRRNFYKNTQNTQAKQLTTPNDSIKPSDKKFGNVLRLEDKGALFFYQGTTYSTLDGSEMMKTGFDVDAWMHNPISNNIFDIITDTLKHLPKDLSERIGDRERLRAVLFCNGNVLWFNDWRSKYHCPLCYYFSIQAGYDDCMSGREEAAEEYEKQRLIHTQCEVVPFYIYGDSEADERVKAECVNLCRMCQEGTCKYRLHDYDGLEWYYDMYERYITMPPEFEPKTALDVVDVTPEEIEICKQEFRKAMRKSRKKVLKEKFPQPKE